MRVSTTQKGQAAFNDEQAKEAAYPEEILKKLRDADAMLNAGKDWAQVLQTLKISEATYQCWRNQYGDMQSEEANRFKPLEVIADCRFNGAAVI